MKRKFSISFITVVILSILLTNIGLFYSSAQTIDAPIRLKAAEFRPAKGEAPAIPPGLEISSYPAGQRGYYIVQFQGPVLEQWKTELTAQGAEVLDYIPHFAFKVRMTPQQASSVKKLNSVAWVGIFHPAYKMDPQMLKPGQGLYQVRMERGIDRAVTAAGVARTGAQILGGGGDLLTVAADAAQLSAIARVLDIAWIEPLQMREPHNEYGAGIIMGATVANANGYDGSTQTVAVADTGLGGGTASSGHPDIPADRITSIYNWPGASDSCWNITDDGAIDVDSGHGTHTAASVLSDGNASGVGKGTAPEACLVFQATENYADMIGICSLYYPDGYYLTGLPSDLNDLYQ